MMWQYKCQLTKKRKKFIWAVSYINIFHPTLNGSDQIDTIEILGTKLKYGVNDRDQCCNLPNII